MSDSRGCLDRRNREERIEPLGGYMYDGREEDEGPGRGARLGEHDEPLRDKLDGNIDFSSFAVLCLSFWRC